MNFEVKEVKKYIKGINLKYLSEYFCDNGDDNPYNDLVNDVEGFDLSVDKEINDLIVNFNSNNTNENEKPVASYIFFTLKGKKYGTFLTYVDFDKDNELIKLIESKGATKVCIKI